MYLVHHFLEHQAAARPDAAAVIDGGSAHSFAEVERRANQVAHALLELGIAPGDRVALLLENSLAYISAYYGVLKAGAVTVALYPTSTERTLRFVLDDCGVRAVVCRPKSLSRLAALAPELPELQGCVVPDEVASSGGFPFQVRDLAALGALSTTAPGVARIDRDRASIIYTSGSTGEPRGAVLQHGHIVANTRSIASYLQLRAEDRVMVVLPFPYVYGKSLLNTHFYAGGSVLLDNRFVFPNVVLKSMQEHEATGFSGVPSTYAILLQKSAVAKMEFPRLRYLTQAGGAMAPALTRQVIDAFSGKDLFIMYGATEASARLSWLSPELLPEKADSIGRAIPNVELRVLKDDGEEAQPGETGELVARGSNIMEGYWNRPEDTAAVLTEEGFRTGDLARRDEDGLFYIVGRKQDMIKSGANRVSAKEIEETLLEHPHIHEAAVIGVADDVLGEAIHAFVVTNGGEAVAEDQLIAFCRDHLVEFKVPRKVYFEKSLPKNDSGKLMKEELRKRFA